MHLPCQPDIFSFQRPHLGNGFVNEFHCDCEGVHSPRCLIDVKEFLQDFRRGEQPQMVVRGFGKEILGCRLQRMRSANRIHEHIGIDEDHVTEDPASLD